MRRVSPIPHIPVSASAIADSGLFIALFSPNDPLHIHADAWVNRFNGQLITVEAVLTESAYFLQRHQRAELAKLAASGMLKVSAPDAAAHRRMATLFEKYANRNPDWADISLIWLAEVSGVMRIVTVDTTDFSVYRANGRNRFDLIDWRSAGFSH